MATIQISRSTLPECHSHSADEAASCVLPHASSQAPDRPAVARPGVSTTVAPGTSAELTGKVVKGSVHRQGQGIAFRVVDRDGRGGSLPVTYTGTVPDPFRGGREIVLTGALHGATFVGEPETLITKCPSKFTTKSDG